MLELVLAGDGELLESVALVGVVLDPVLTDD